MSIDLNNHFIAVVTFDPASLTLKHRRYDIKTVEQNHGSTLEDVKFNFENAGYAGFVFKAVSRDEAHALADTILPNPDHVGGITILSDAIISARLKDQQAALNF